MDLLRFFVFDVPHDHVKGKLIIDEVSIAPLKSHAFVKMLFLVLAHAAMDIVDEFTVQFILLRQLLAQDLTVYLAKF